MTTAEKITPIILETYGSSLTDYTQTFINDVAKVIDEYPESQQAKLGEYGRSREEVIMLRLWDWMSGGDTAASTAKKIEEIL